MVTTPHGLVTRERRAVLLGPLYRLVGTPVTAALSLLNVAVIVRETGAEVFGLVSLVATVTLLFPFADFGVGDTVISASAQLRGASRDPRAADVIRRGYQVLTCVAIGVIALALVVMAADGWASIVGFSSGAQDRWAITVASCLFGLTIPAGLGVRMLIGVDRNPLATLVLMTCPAFALGLTLLLRMAGVDGIWYVTSSLGGLLAGQAVGTVIALRLTRLDVSVLTRARTVRSSRRLLEGSLWLFLVAVGLAAGCQSGRMVLAHLSTPDQLAGYALLAMVYAACWQVLSAAGLAFWPVFVRRRSAVEETIRTWRRLVVVFAAGAAVAGTALWWLGPWIARVLSDGAIVVAPTLGLAFGLLLVGQAMHLPAAVLLTRPNEARWQAIWTTVMAVLSVGLACVVAGAAGAVGVVLAAAVAVALAQVVPDVCWVPRVIRRRTDDLAAGT